MRLTLVGMVEKCAWGDVPPGFKRFSPDPRRTIVVREGWEMYLDLQRFLSEREAVTEVSPFYGRDRIFFLRLNNGETALVRAYRHGGALRHLTGDFFFTWPPRPFKELVMTEEVRRRGIPTLEVFGAWVERVWGPFYRGWLLTRELKGAYNLWDVLRGSLYAETGGERLLQAVARTVRWMHCQGVYHGDLNLKNILVRREGSEVRSYIIDFDRARLFPGEIPEGKAKRNLRRLLRSISKLDPARHLLSRDDWELFVQFYREARAG